VKTFTDFTHCPGDVPEGDALPLELSVLWPLLGLRLLAWRMENLSCVPGREALAFNLLELPQGFAKELPSNRLPAVS
jgi:hypothetical protein